MELHLPVILNFSINNQIAIPFWSKEVMEIHLKEKHIFLNQMNDFLNGLSFNSSITEFIINVKVDSFFHMDLEVPFRSDSYLT
jgi:hypothetical protein